MRIGVIGAGSMGRILSRRLGKLGHHVSIANSRGPESLTALAAEIGATPVSVIAAAQTAEIVFIAIPTKAVTDLPRELFANVADSVVVIDIGNYHPELRDGRIDAIDRGMLDSRGSRSRSGVLWPCGKLFADARPQIFFQTGDDSRHAETLVDACQLCSNELTPSQKSFHCVIILLPVATNQLKAQNIESAAR